MSAAAANCAFLTDGGDVIETIAKVIAERQVRLRDALARKIRQVIAKTRGRSRRPS